MWGSMLLALTTRSPAAWGSLRLSPALQYSVSCSTLLKRLALMGQQSLSLSWGNKASLQVRLGTRIPSEPKEEACLQPPMRHETLPTAAMGSDQPVAKTKLQQQWELQQRQRQVLRVHYLSHVSQLQEDAATSVRGSRAPSSSGHSSTAQIASEPEPAAMAEQDKTALLRVDEAAHVNVDKAAHMSVNYTAFPMTASTRTRSRAARLLSSNTCLHPGDACRLYRGASRRRSRSPGQ